ncbi:16S rRNA (guanine1207-N2)-methyltransferase [Friedmanniella endophytica]|uniref:16S rRNA (Guanine1207-N2)-methyltransferase n=1 Tax=Microlunatus kandeliicorticis TaxID=1759536 RepID=A0A7W3P527_9ACTN|nr:class I SAM-dependent methyltransferase [Microlunatus kandeliicorticis]MBA8793422.1 16S rRNA (guanine1207-N2)-methyltransferase [Microlunatus kandeliicorticis]
MDATLPPDGRDPGTGTVDDGPDALPAAERLLLDVAAETSGRTGGWLACLDLDPGAPGAAVERLSPEAVVVHHDRLSDERRQHERLVRQPGGTDPRIRAVDDPRSAVNGARVVLHRIPPSLDALDELATMTAAHGEQDVVLLGVGNNRHLSRSMNDVLGRSFGSVRASRGRGKFRVLVASEPRDDVDPDRFPARRAVEELDLTVVAHGGVFAGARLDAGTRLLLGTRDRWPTAGAAVDLGCGTGVLAATVARLGHRPVLAIDESAAACRSAEATMAANGLSGAVTVVRQDGLGEQDARSADLVVSNPPFHRGTAKDSAPALTMISEAGRVLRPGGELWLVYNSHLPYLPALRRVGRTELVARDRSYLVTRTVAAGPRTG